jgi:hypothetical protein
MFAFDQCVTVNSLMESTSQLLRVASVDNLSFWMGKTASVLKVECKVASFLVFIEKARKAALLRK